MTTHTLAKKNLNSKFNQLSPHLSNFYEMITIRLQIKISFKNVLLKILSKTIFCLKMAVFSNNISNSLNKIEFMLADKAKVKLISKWKGQGRSIKARLTICSDCVHLIEHLFDIFLNVIVHYRIVNILSYLKQTYFQLSFVKSFFKQTITQFKLKKRNWTFWNFSWTIMNIRVNMSYRKSSI